MLCSFEVYFDFLAGKPLIHRMKLRVLPNPLAVVPGLHEVSILFCVSGDCREWKEKLPNSMRSKLEKDNSTSFHGIEEHIIIAALGKANLNKFPYLPSDRSSFSPLVVGLLSQLASYQLIESPEVKDLLKNM